MKKYSILSFLFTAELIIYVSGIVFFSSGLVDGFVEALPINTFGIGVSLFILFIVILFFSQNNGTLLYSSRSAFLFSLLVIAAVHGTATHTLYPYSPLYLFYYILVIIYGTLGTATLLCTVFSFFLISELMPLFIVLSQNAYQSQQTSISLQRLIQMLPHIGYITACGGITFFVAAVRNKSKGRFVVPSLHHQIIADHCDTQNDTNHQKKGISKLSSTVLPASDNQQSCLQEYFSGDELSSVVFFMSRNFNAYSALGFIYDASRKLFYLNSCHSKSLSLIRNVEIPAGKGIVGNLAVEHVSFLSGSLANYDQRIHYYSKNELINSVLAVPILSYKNDLLGALVIDSKDKLAFRDHHKEVLLRFSQLAAALITNVRMRMYQERAAKNFQIFYEAAEQFAKIRHSEQVLDILFRMIELITPYTRIIAVDFYPDATNCGIRRIVGAKQSVREEFSFPLNEGLFSQVLKRNKEIVIDNFDMYRNKCYLFMPDEHCTDQLKSIILIPFTTTGTTPRGVIAVESNKANQFQGETAQLLITLVSNAAVAYQKAILYQKMETLATTDGLTQLCNYRTFQDYFQKEIVRALRYKRPLSLLLLDIDFFKKFNDTYGHQVGDLVLKEIAQCLKHSTRSNDIPARYGGEEFAVILPETDLKGAVIIGERIRQTIEKHIIVAGEQRLKVTVSIGCANIPQHSNNPQGLTKCADTALYYSKAHGRNRLTLFKKGIESLRV